MWPIPQELRTKPKGNFRVNFIHGHNGNVQLHPSTHTNLDNQLGKTKTINKEHDYFTRTSRELTAKKYVKSIKNLKTYKYKCKKSFSFFSVNANTFNGIDKKYEKLEGSNLKLHILLDFEKKFKKEKKCDSRNKLINSFKKSDEYRVLKKSRKTTNTRAY